MTALLQWLWYRSRCAGWLLLPLAWLYTLLSALRKRRLLAARPALATPVVVVGNIHVGGTGKTPLLMAIVQHLQQQGIKPAVISRGYGGKTRYPCLLNDSHSAADVGDEPLMIYRRCRCPVVVDPDRYAAARYVEQHCQADVIISDDGLQHYRLPRDVEIVVMDAARGFGNGLRLPAGPLRESQSRLATVDFLVTNGDSPQRWHAQQHAMQLQPQALLPVTNDTRRPAPLAGDTVHALAGIGHPQRFFATLQQLGYRLQAHAFADHYAFSADDVSFADDLAVVMTEKDAVKCRPLAGLDRHFYLPVTAVLPQDFWQQLMQRLASINKV